jgi:signal transduction histidine kinase/CheY-like chemotaxis protein
LTEEFGEGVEMKKEKNDIKIEKTQTLDTMLHQILNQALVAIEAEAGSLMLVDNKRGILQIKARLGKPRVNRKTEPVYKIGENSIAGWVAKNKKSRLCYDIEKVKDFEPSRSGKNFSSLLSIPVIYKNEVIAVINADSIKKDDFTKWHEKKLNEVAELVASPIAERISIFDALSEVGVELSRLPSEGGVDRVLLRIAQLAVRSLGADVVTIYPYFQDKDEFPVEGKGPAIAPSVMDPRPMHRKIYPGDVPWTVVKERKSGFYSNVKEVNFLKQDVHRPDEDPRKRFIERESIESMAALLLPSRAEESPAEEVVGVMFANYRTPHEFNIDEISALSSFADYAAAAILNSRHEEKRGAEQIRMVETILANFAHRMNNLSGTSRVATQILREYIDASDDLLNRQLDRIEVESNILLELAERLSRPFKETGRLFDLSPLDISKILDLEVDRLEPELSLIIVEKRVADNIPRVISVEFQLLQVLHDIISNSIKAMKDSQCRKLIIEASYNRLKNCVEVEISDTGAGVSEKIREKLFSPGTTTNDNSLGMGLWWCRTFMQATGGDVFLKKSVLNQGATFTVVVPCADQKECSLIDKLPTKDILIVDDDQSWRDTFIDILTSEMYSIEIARNYEEATTLLKKNRFRLAVVDIRLEDAVPDNKDGLILLADIDQANLNTKVIIVTGYGTEEYKEIANKSSRLIKFINKEKLDMHTIKHLIQQTLGKI